MKPAKASFRVRELCASHKIFFLGYFFFQLRLKRYVQLVKVDLQKQKTVKKFTATDNVIKKALNIILMEKHQLVLIEFR